MANKADWGHSAFTGLLCAFVAISTIVVPMRFWARRRNSAPILADDWLMVPALMSFIGLAAVVYRALDLKTLGYSSHEFTPEEVAKTYEESTKLQVIFMIIHIFCIGLVKMSALLFYRRIFCVSGRKAALNIIILVSVGLVAAWIVTFMFLAGFQCHTHFSALWDGNYLKYCDISLPYQLGEGVSDFLFDVWVLFLPMPLVLRLQASRARRASILGIFVFAAIGIGASIARLVILVDSQKGGQAAYIFQDPEQVSTRLTFYITLETGVALVAVNLPSILLIFASLTPEKILQSVRSVFSLVSVGSRRSQGSKGTPRSQIHNENLQKAGSSVSSIAPLGQAAGPSYALSDLQKQEVEGGSNDEIRIQRSKPEHQSHA